MGKVKDDQLSIFTNEDHLMDEYFRYLCQIVGNTDENGNTYFVLLKKLHQLPFTWFVPNDDNRAEEGIKLRRGFAQEWELDELEEDILNRRGCSFLELVIGLATNMDDLLTEPMDRFNIDIYFWELIENVGLIKFSDHDFHYQGGYFEVSRIVMNVLQRDYGRNGEGGLFPLRETTQDQRKVELWYQMHAYLEETHSFSTWS